MALICPPIQNIDKDGCLNNIGGNKLTMYVFSTDERLSMTEDKTNWVIDSIEYKNGSTASVPVSISYHKNTAALTESAAGVAETANQTNTVTVTITVNNRQYNKSKSISILGAGQRELDLIVQQNNGTNWFIPNATLTGTETASGATRADGSNYVLTFTAELDELAFGIESADLTSLLTTGKIA